ncbi:MAG: sigma-54-dependent transcriptional regulator [Myxococcaceae bacterium]
MPILRSVLVADDEASLRHVLSLVLQAQGYEVRAVSNGEEALAELETRDYDAVISDVRMPRMDGLTVLRRALVRQPDLTFVVMSAYGQPDAALEAVAAGAFDYVSKPFKPEEVVLVLKKAEERRRLVTENRRLRRSGADRGPLDRIVGSSEAVQQLHKQILKLAPVSTTVLISGESGTGKELVARALHELSPRAAMPFVPVNCGAIPPGLVESELFGHARGAFTDARSAKRGLFAEADGGTLLLDEAGELPPAAQIKLLRFLQEGEIRAVGENRSERVDVRVLAATHRDLGKLVERGEFREDLYYRLNVVNLAIPPLRARREDVLQLARAFLLRFNRELNRQVPVTGFEPGAEELLASYGWPGNVRELENAIERAVLLAEGTLVTVQNLPERIWSTPRSPERPPASARGEQAQEDLSLKRAMRSLEERYIRAALRKTRGNRTRASELLEISHRALLYKIKEYGIDADAEGELG